MEYTDPPAPEQNDPLALASAVLGPVGIAVYCCGSFMCIGWLAFPVWLVGLVLGGLSASRTQGTSRTIGIVGAVVNGLCLVLFAILMVAGVGLTLLAPMLENR